MSASASMGCRTRLSVCGALLAMLSCSETHSVYLGRDELAARAPEPVPIPPPVPVASPPAPAVPTRPSVGTTFTPASAPLQPRVPPIDAGRPSPPPDAGPPPPPPPPMTLPPVDAGPPMPLAPTEASCSQGYEDCDADQSNGCETDTTTSQAHCGGCDQVCEPVLLRSASAECVNGVCEITCALPGIQDDCDGDPSNGCETDLFHDVENCGECDRHCTLCLDGICL